MKYTKIILSISLLILSLKADSQIKYAQIPGGPPIEIQEEEQTANCNENNMAIQELSRNVQVTTGFSSAIALAFWAAYKKSISFKKDVDEKIESLQHFLQHELKVKHFLQFIIAIPTLYKTYKEIKDQYENSFN